jgi:ParB/RepB/Spo0J family partition protein
VTGRLRRTGSERRVNEKTINERRILMTDIQMIPLNKLYVAESNVRKTAADDDLGNLVASIEAHGLLQSIVVQPGKRGHFAIIAGGRRYRALSALAEADKLPVNYGVPCHVIAADADATELSLAENIVRAPMHPADQFEASSRLSTKAKRLPTLRGASVSPSSWSRSASSSAGCPQRS